MSNKEVWRALAERIIVKGKLIFDTSSVFDSEKGTKDPKVWALAILARTIGNVESALILLDNERLIEARTLVRCCYENFFCSAALVKTGDEFIKTMELDDAASRKRQAKGLLEWADKEDQKLSFAENLHKFAEDMNKKHPKTPAMHQKKNAEDGTIKDAYIFYQVLSHDSAHPSARSLSRYIAWDGDGDDAQFTLSAFPTDEPGEVEETLEFACSVVLGVCVAVNEAVGGTESGERLWTLGDEYRALSDASKVARDQVKE
jgi:hypothetical protein